MRNLNNQNGQQFDLIAESRSDDFDSSTTIHHEENEDLNEDLNDPYCVEDNPQRITFEDVTSAAFKIKCGIINTPCVKSRLSDTIGVDLYLKKDFLQVTGSFKERGARYALVMLSEEQKKIGVISASLGNHAGALCYHGYKLGIPVTVVMPVIAPIMKIVACRQYGANVIVDGLDMEEARRIALRRAKEKGLTYINGYDYPDVIAGQGTLGLEIVEQVSNIDAVVIPIGGGGLIAGVALAVKNLHPNVTIIGVESEKCPSFYKARKADRPTYTRIDSTLADGLAVPMVGYNAFATANPLIDKLVVVKEEWIAIAILKLVENEKCIVEGAGATGLAAILAGQLEELKGKRVVLPLSGGNIDTTILGRCLDRGLAAEGRLLKFTVTVSDRPGGIAELCRMLASIGVSIKDIMHERAWIMSDIFSVDVKVVCETRNREHAEQLKNMLYQKYQKVVFGTSDVATLNLPEVKEEDLIDPYCVEDNPQTIPFKNVTSAAFKIKYDIINTPCVKSRLSDTIGVDLYLKKDFLQVTGSFKERGARYALVMLSDEQKKLGVVSASCGNHAAAISYHGYKLGIPVTVVMPVIAPVIKIIACRQYGANVIVHGPDMEEARRTALRTGKEKGLVYINGYDHPDIVAGQGTLGLEIVEQVPNIDAVVIPIGGGGLIAGVALAVKSLHPSVTIIGVESEMCPSFYKARKAGRPTYTPVGPTLAEGLAVPVVGYNAFATANPLIDKLVVVREDWIAVAILKLLEEEKCIVEGAGAIGLAAILAGQLEELKGKRVVVPLSGGNIGTMALVRCLERGLAVEGRLLKFTVTVSDRADEVAELCRMLASVDVSIKDITYERTWIMTDFFSVDVRVLCETRNREHTEQLKKLLHQKYQKIVFAPSDVAALTLP